MADVRLIEGDCTAVLPTLPAASFDVVLTDPPYPCIKRSYGTWTEAEWWGLMRAVVPECMRLLKPTGSAVFILQPNSERVGRMRTWLWDFQAWVGREWGIVQDVWWWNNAVLSSGISIRGRLTRPSVKACVWVGPADCYRDQEKVLLPLGEWVRRKSYVTGSRHKKTPMPSGQGVAIGRVLDTAMRRGGSTPFNCIVCTKGPNENMAVQGHSAATPLKLADWWLRYLAPSGGAICDPFSGSGTVALAAYKLGLSAVGIERVPEYHAIAERRLAEAQAATPLFTDTSRVE